MTTRAAAIALALAACTTAPAPQRAPAPSPSPAAAELRARGHDLFFARAACHTCHSVGAEGTQVRGPNLGGVASRREDLPVLDYLVESVLDPDAYTVPSYAPGVMKRPDQPPISLTDDELVAIAVFLAGQPAATEPALAAARARIPLVRRARDQRLARDRAAAVLARIPWDEADPARGHSTARSCGCSLCHDNPANAEVKAPSLVAVGQRLSRDDVARWLVAPPKSRMPSYAETLTPQALADLVLAVTSGEPPR